MNCTVTVRECTFESLGRDWEELLKSRTGVTVFDTLAWQRTWWEEFGAGATLRLLSVSEDGGRPLLIAPLMSRGSTVSFLGGTDLVDYHDFLTADGPRREHVECIMRELARDPSCGCIELLSLPGGSPTIEMVPPLARSLGWQVEVAQEDVAPRMALPTTFEAYVEGLSKHDRHELRRKMRRLEAAGNVKEYDLTAPAEVSAGLDDFLALHRKSLPEKAEFMTPAREKFFRRAASRLAESGVTRLRFLELDGKRVASSVSWVTGGTRYLYNSGYEPAHRDLSVGLLSHVYAIRAAIAEGLNVFDFLRGNEPYKYHLGGQDRPVFKVVCKR